MEIKCTEAEEYFKKLDDWVNRFSNAIRTSKKKMLSVDYQFSQIEKNRILPNN